MHALIVYQSKFQKKRYGNPDGDGGYVMATGLSYDFFISCGIADDVSFEKQFLDENDNIEGLAFDGTIESIPENIKNLTFIKKNISYFNSESTTNLHDIIQNHKDVMLKMDIETYEYKFLQILSETHLQNIKQLVIEFHFPFNEPGFTHLDKPLPVNEKMACLEKLAKTHYLIHFKPNTACGKTLYNGIIVPNVFECTYLRKDMEPNIRLNIETIPGVLDKKNRSDDPEIFINYWPFVSQLNITTFGSCRQESLKKYYNITNIQQNLTYPHYTKEIIQAIELCKKINTNLDTKICFRTGILNKQSISCDFEDQFNLTDVFVVEIASRVSYEYNGMYVHHILTESEYGFDDISNIKTRIQTDSEIENDLYRIRELLYPKPFLIVSHLYTRKTGKRYELIELLRDLTSKMNIPFMSPSDILSTDCYQDEPTLMHFNEIGHTLIGKEYLEKIEEIRAPKNVLRNVYYTDGERVKKHTFHGLGDFIRGSVAMYNFCKKNNLIPEINFSHHNISKFLHSKSYISLEETKNAIYPDQMHTDTFPTETPNIFTNAFYKNIDSDAIDFIKENILTPRIEFIHKIETIVNTLGLVKGEYKVIHIRLHDDNNSDYDSIFSKIREEDMNGLFISSSNKFSEFLKSKKLRTTGLKGCHLGLLATEEEVQNTLLELFLMIYSNSIIQYSVYGWGSGFSEIASIFYKIPITKISL